MSSYNVWGKPTFLGYGLDYSLSWMISVLLLGLEVIPALERFERDLYRRAMHRRALYRRTQHRRALYRRAMYRRAMYRRAMYRRTLYRRVLRLNNVARPIRCAA